MTRYEVILRHFSEGVETSVNGYVQDTDGDDLVEALCAELRVQGFRKYRRAKTPERVELYRSGPNRPSVETLLCVLYRHKSEVDYLQSELAKAERYISELETRVALGGET